MKKSSLHICFIGLGFVSIIILGACKKVAFDKIASSAFSPTMAVPIGFAEFGIYEVLSSNDSNSIIVSGSDGALSLVYTNRLDLKTAGELITIPNQNVAFNSSSGGYGVAATPSYSGTQTINSSQENSLNPGDALFKFTEIDFRSGDLTVTASSTMMHDLEFVLTFPDLTIAGVPVTRTISLVYAGVPMSGTATVNLNNALLNLAAGSNGFNDVSVDLEITINGQGNPITGNESIDVGLNFNSIDFDVIRGDFGNQQLFDVQDTIAIKFFDGIPGGTLQFTDPSLRFRFMNSFGIPLGLNINEIKSIEDNNGNEVMLTGFDPTFDIDAATSPGLTQTSTLTLSNSNTQNINSIFNLTPKRLIFDINGETNPSGPANNFVANESRLSVEGTLNLPLEGYAAGFTVTDTVEFGQTFDSINVEYVEFRIITDNGFPIEINVDIVMLDINYNELGKLSENSQIVGAAPVGVSGRVTENNKKITDIRIDNSKLSIFNQTKYIKFSVGGQTYNGNLNQVVKMFEDYKIKVNLGIKGQFNIEI
ncbi:MAG: hypothetical protein ACI9XP_000107 [Lentimonas sp.]|jgi:hypothetical protein